MKNLSLFICFLLFAGHIIAQRQLNIQGVSNSTDTVATIKVNPNNDNENVVGLAVYSVIPISESFNGTAGYFEGGVYGVYGESNNVGIQGNSTSGVAIRAYSDAGFGLVAACTTGIAVKAESTSNNAIRADSDSGSAILCESEDSYGIRARSRNSIGVFGESLSEEGIAVYGETDVDKGRSVKGEAFGERSIGVMGIALDSFSTGVWAEGLKNDFVAAGPGLDYESTSSIRWKNNIDQIKSALDKISSLRGVYFDWDTAHGGHRDIGMIAEEVGSIIPEIVSYEDNGMDARGIDYARLTPLLVEGMKEILQDIYFFKIENEALKKSVSDLTTRLQKIEKLLAQ